MDEMRVASEWPTAASALTLAQLSRLTAVDVADLSKYRAGKKRMSSATAERVAVVAQIDPAGYLATRQIATYSQIALVIKREAHSDTAWVLRALSRAMQEASNLTNKDDARAFHARPPKTGSRPWDALLAAVAEMTWQRLIPDEAVPAWMRSVRELDSWWSPIDYADHLSWAFLRTPINLRERHIVLNSGELETV